MIRWITFQNRKISYKIKGSGPTLVLLHGYLLSSASWGLFFDKLSFTFQVIAPDLPGHGISELTSPSNTMDSMAESVDAILEEEKIDFCFMLGHSMGGYVALAFLEHFPERLSKLILLNTYPFADATEKIITRNRAIEIINQGRKDLYLNLALKELLPEDNPDEPDSTYATTLDIINLQSAESLCTTLEGMKARPDRSGLLLNPTIPVKWILSKNDNQLDANTFRVRAHSLRMLKPEIIAGGHMSFIEEPDLICSLVLDFFDPVI